MQEEVQNQAELPVNDQVEDQNIESPVIDQEANEEVVAKTPKTFTQEELDKVIAKRLAKESRKLERQYAAKLAEFSNVQTPKAVDSVEPDNSAAYLESLAAQKAEEMVRDREFKARQAQAIDAYHDREEEARDKYDDFEQVAYNPNLRVTGIMAQAIQVSDVGPDVAYWLGSNPKEADRISKLPELMQVKEIGKIEAKLSAEPVTKKVSSAPAPIAPVSARNTQSHTFDTTDPRSAKTMSDSQWIEAERRRQMQKLQNKIR